MGSFDVCARAFERLNEHVWRVIGPHIAAEKKKLSSSDKKSSYTLPAGIFKIKSPLMKGTAVRRIQEALAALYFYPYKEAKNNDIEMAAAGRKRRTRSNGSS
ncbi:hypothetical protein RSC2_02022 [Bacillus paralicheniformis]|uniref:N-acetylmuramoyl-L-alanine amidase n=2 Tax=Bacillus paralicheniformis TaxID=1648923 RepID=A0A7Z0X1Q8_9BACI|nr:N-acetylmuramoyl-L-alanine amidase [Bacillus paralicheniformis]BCE04041.1 hypothetical protein RSC1_00198 [Bacillus paralicheniformis]BCE10226.1 hypothetical protein RSC2_02022 [Bacillus paralicheniformis]BCE16424.1 hypothetical protein RSC3_03780 [Bacillus paralicheniformis]